MKMKAKDTGKTRAPGWEYPSGIFYRRACEMMGIDPDNNPNYMRKENLKEETND